MRVSIRDRGALSAVSPAALSAYARAAGWCRHETYGEHSDVYVGESRPEIIVPRTERLGDYASVVATLIDTFAGVTGQDELSVYRSLATADRDVVRVRAAGSDNGSVTLNDGVDLIVGTRDLVLSAACSLGEPQPVYRAGAKREAADLLRQMRLGQTDQGSFVVTLLTPVVPPPMPSLLPDPDDRNAPIERRMTRRLVEAVTAAWQATERAAAGDDAAFEETVASGVSANLCEALVRIIEPFETLDVSVSWAPDSAGCRNGNRRPFQPGGCGPHARGGAGAARAGAPTRSASPRLRAAPEARGGRRRRDDPFRDRHRWATAVGRGGFWSRRTTNGRFRLTGIGHRSCWRAISNARASAGGC